MEKIGFIGLGLMGQPMSQHLLEDFSLYVYNRTRSKADELLEEGAIWVDSPRELADLCEVVIVIVSDDQASKEVISGNQGLLHSANRPIIINMSTITPTATISLAEEATSSGYGYIEAPVSGTVGPAKQGTLTIIAAGNPDLISQVRPILERFGKHIFQFANLGDASTVKLLINLNLAVQTAILSETLTGAEQLGIDPKAVLEVVNNSAVSTIISKIKGPNMVKGDFPIAFPYHLLIKDLKYGTELSEMPLATKTLEIYLQADHELDFSAIYQTYQDWRK